MGGRCPWLKCIARLGLVAVLLDTAGAPSARGEPTGPPPPTQGASHMSDDIMAATLQILDLPDDEYFLVDGNRTTEMQLKIAPLTNPTPGSPGQERVGVPELRALAAPGFVDGNTRKSFPVLLTEIRSNQRDWAVHPKQNRFFLSSNAVTGATSIVAPLDTRRRTAPPPPSASGPPPDSFNAALSVVAVSRYDLFRWFPLRALQGRTTLWALEYDLASNGVTIDTEGPEPLPVPGASLMDDSRLLAAPYVSKSSLDGLKVEFPGRVAGTEPALMHGVFLGSRPSIATLAATNGDAAPFLAAVTVVFVQLDLLQPFMVPLKVPAQVHDGRVTAAWTIDLSTALAGKAAPGAWLAWVVAGDQISGPHPVQLQ